MPYDNFKSHKKPVFHPLFRGLEDTLFEKPQGGGGGGAGGGQIDPPPPF